MLANIFVVVVLVLKSVQSLNCRNAQINEYCVAVDYDVDQLPPNPPMEIQASIVISEVSAVNDASLAVSVRLIFYFFWNDTRVERLQPGDKNLNLGLQNIDKYFVPDFYIYNLLDYKQMDFFTDVKAILLTPRGEIWLYMEGIVTTACSMNFYNFPHDSHRCQVLFGSTGYPDSLMTFDASISYSNNSQRPLQYDITIQELNEEEKLTVYASGNYSVTGFWVELKRKTTAHLLQIFMPSAMFVVVSWISFLMPHGGGERAGLIVTLFLVLVSMFLAVVTTSPKAETLTAMETWVIVCLVFVFLALLEYGIVLKMIASKKSKSKMEFQADNSKKFTLDKKLEVWQNTEPEDSNSSDNKKGFCKGRDVTSRIDEIALAVLPALFLLFNIIYWVEYTA